MTHICFIVAMMAEAQPLIDHFALAPLGQPFTPLPMKAFAGSYKEQQITLVVNGTDSNQLDYIGCEAATLATQLAITTYRPQLLVNAGTAGGFKAHGAEIGDIYLSHKHVVFHDRRIAIPGWDSMGQGYAPCIDTTALAAESGYKQGICTSGSSLDMTPYDYEQMAITGGEVKDMEAAAIAWVAQLHSTPFLAIKAITDIVDSGRPTAEEFNANLQQAAIALREACFLLVERKLLVAVQRE